MCLTKCDVHVAEVAVNRQPSHSSAARPTWASAPAFYLSPRPTAPARAAVGDTGARRPTRDAPGAPMAGSDDAPSATEAARRAKLERLRGKRRSSKSKAGDQASSSSPPASAPTSPDDLGGFPSFDAAAPPAEASAPTMRGVAEAPPDFGSDAKALEDRWGTAAYLLRNPKLPDAAALARTALAARDRRGKRAVRVRCNMSVPRAIVPKKGSTLRGRSERSSPVQT